MIGFDHIGTMGRLGNQMFQYAALKGIASHRGYEYTIPPENPKIQIDNYGLIEAFELSDNKKIYKYLKIKEHIDITKGIKLVNKWFESNKYYF